MGLRREGNLKDYIRKTVFAVCQDDKRPVLGGEYWEVGETESLIAATDTHRLSVVNLPARGDEKKSFNIPSKALNFVRNMIGSDEEEVRILLSQNLVSFSSPRWNLTNRMIEGKYPDIRRVIPSEHVFTWRIPTAALSSVLRRIRVLNKDHKTRADMTNFAGSGDTLKVSVVGFDAGEGSEEIDMSSEGGDFSITLNAKYLQEALAVCDDMVEMHMSEPLKPVLMVSGEGLRLVLMPMDPKGLV
jgi:DNA polymerase III subunit beta